VASYTVSLLDPKVIRDLRLKENGLEIVNRPYANFMPLPGGNYLRTGRGLDETQAQFRRFSTRDADRLPDYYAMLDRGADLVRDLLLECPPNAGGGLRDVIQALKLGNRVRKLDLPATRDVLDLFTKSAGDVLDYWFETDAIKGLFGFDSVVGTFASPYTPGSAYVLLHHVFGEVNDKRGQWGHAIGGMGAITQAMARECERRGVVVRTDAAVADVLVEGGHAAGVRLEGGEVVRARRVAANVNPKLLFSRLVDPSHVDADFRMRIDRYRCASGSLRINVALSELPRFAGLPADESENAARAGIIIGPSLRYLEQAYFDAREHGWSKAPVIEMLIPSTIDPTLAPRGAHVASLFCQQFSPALPDGRSWDDAKDAAAQAVIDTVDGYAPNFKRSIVGQMVLSPLDLERTFGLVGGDIFHGALSLDQLFSARPVLGYGNYRTPVRGLYLCGSGTHPGGGVTGAPGHNAAAEIIRDSR